MSPIPARFACLQRTAPQINAGDRAWAERLPEWLEVVPVTASSDPSFQGLDEREKEALVLAQLLPADLILMDDRKGSNAASRSGFAVIGTLGILVRASQREILDLPGAFDRLRNTNFRFRQEMLDALLDKQKGRQ